MIPMNYRNDKEINNLLDSLLKQIHECAKGGVCGVVFTTTLENNDLTDEKRANLQKELNEVIRDIEKARDNMDDIVLTLIQIITKKIETTLENTSNKTDNILDAYVKINIIYFLENRIEQLNKIIENFSEGADFLSMPAFMSVSTKEYLTKLLDDINNNNLLEIIKKENENDNE